MLQLHFSLNKNTKLAYFTGSELYLQKNYLKAAEKLLKGYLRNKTITSQNLPYEPQLDILLFQRKTMFRSCDI